MNCVQVVTEQGSVPPSESKRLDSEHAQRQQEGTDKSRLILGDNTDHEVADDSDETATNLGSAPTSALWPASVSSVNEVRTSALFISASGTDTGLLTVMMAA